MKKAGSIISIIAGVFSVIAAVIEMSIGGIGQVVEAENASDISGAASLGLILSFIVIISGAIQSSSTDKWASGTLVIVSLLGMFLGNTLVAVCMVLSLIGGILGLTEKRNKNAVVSSENLETKEDIKQEASNKTSSKKLVKLIVNIALVLCIMMLLALIWGGFKGVKEGNNDQSSTSNLDFPDCASEEGVRLAKNEMNTLLAKHRLDTQIEVLRRGINTNVLGDEVIDILEPAEMGTSTEKRTRYCTGMAETKLSANVRVYYDFRRLNDGTIHITVSAKQSSLNSASTAENTSSNKNYSKEDVKKLREQYYGDYEDDGDDEKDSDERESCNEPFPCRLKTIIDKNDWNKVVSALSFGFEAQIKEKITWKNEKSGKNGYVQLLSMGNSAKCIQFSVVSSKKQKSENDEIMVCREDNGILKFY